MIKKEAIRCVYEIRNLTNDAVYIGSTKDFKARKQVHMAQLNTGKHVNTYLQRAWNKYGPKNFAFSVVEEVTEEEQFDKEQELIDKYLRDDKVIYNLCVSVYNPGLRRPMVKQCEYYDRRTTFSPCGETFETIYANQKYCHKCTILRQENWEAKVQNEKTIADIAERGAWETMREINLWLDIEDGECEDPERMLAPIMHYS